MLEPKHKSIVDDSSIRLDPKLIELDIDLLIRNCLHKLAADISDNLLLLEVTCLYKNKIYDDKSKKNLSRKINHIAEEVNLTIFSYFEVIKEEIMSKVYTI